MGYRSGGEELDREVAGAFRGRTFDGEEEVLRQAGSIGSVAARKIDRDDDALQAKGSASRKPSTAGRGSCFARDFFPWYGSVVGHPEANRVFQALTYDVSLSLVEFKEQFAVSSGHLGGRDSNPRDPQHLELLLLTG